MSKCRYQAEPRGAFGLAGGWCATHDEGWNWCIDALRAQLAQREEEIEALRGLARNVIDSQDAAMQHPVTEDKIRASMNAVAALRASLSDDQEGQDEPL